MYGPFVVCEKKSEDISNFKDEQKPIIVEDTIILALI